MKVCQLTAVDFSLKHFLLPLVDGMQRQGWSVTCVCSDGAAIAGLRTQGYVIKTIPIARSLNPLAALRSVIALTRLFRRERFDIVHVHTPVAAVIGRIAAKLAGVPLVVYTAHGFYFHEGMSSWKYRLVVWLERLAGCLTHLLFTQSQEDAQAAIAEKIMPAKDVLAIGNGVDVHRFDPDKVESKQSIRAALGVPENAFVVGMIGRQVREKGIAEFLQAGQMLAAKHSHLWLLLVGARLASDHARCVSKDFAHAQTALSERLIAPGLRDDIPQLLAAMDVFCLPSWREGMPRSIIEAMMMGKPVVATNIRGSREEVINQVTGLLVPVRSPEQLAQAIEQLLVDPHKAQSFGQAGRKRALELYDEDKIVALQIQRISLKAEQRGLTFHRTFDFAQAPDTDGYR